MSPCANRVPLPYMSGMIRALALALAFLPALALPAAAEKLSLAALSAYLNGLERAKGAFTQLNADGTISTGTVYLHRPGRIRFEYDPPEPALVVAGGGTVAVFDLKSNVPPEQFPLRRTPLSLILARDVDLSRSGMVVGHDFDGLATTVTARDPENPELGEIRLVFTADPVELRQWIILDQARSETTVILGDLEEGLTLSPALFDITREVDRVLGQRGP